MLQYVLGLGRLGHEVYFVEPIQPKALRPLGGTLAGSENGGYFNLVTREFGLHQKSALLLAGTQQTLGLSYTRLRDISQRADLLLNISGIRLSTAASRWLSVISTGNMPAITCRSSERAPFSFSFV